MARSSQFVVRTNVVLVVDIFGFGRVVGDASFILIARIHVVFQSISAFEFVSQLATTLARGFVRTPDSFLSQSGCVSLDPPVLREEE